MYTKEEFEIRKRDGKDGATRACKAMGGANIDSGASR
jgi:hypothetical protein